MPDNKKRKQYTEDFKDSILKRIENKENVTFLSEELNIPRTTIYQWVRNYNKNKENKTIILGSKNKFNSSDKLHMLNETAALSEIELGEYCRRKGIYVEDIKAWKDEYINKSEDKSKKTKELEEALKSKEKELKNKDEEFRTEIKALKKELKRKDKALAEAAALLILRKKLNAIWGDQEEE